MINLNELIKQAMKTHNSVGLSVYRSLKSEIQKYETSKGAKPMSDSVQLSIFNKYVKQLEDSIEQFKSGGRADLAESTLAELNVVKELLPEPVHPQKILDFIKSDEYFNKYKPAISDFIIVIPKKEMGTCIKYVKSKFPTADGKMISNIIKAMVI